MSRMQDSTKQATFLSSLGMLSVLPELERQRQEEFKFQANLGHMVRPGPTLVSPPN